MQLVDNAMTILVLVVSWQSRVFTRPINMQKYTWDGEELTTGLYQSDDNANSHLPNVLCVRMNIISCCSEAASLVHWPSFSSRVLLPLPGWRQGSGGLSVRTSETGLILTGHAPATWVKKCSFQNCHVCAWILLALLSVILFSRKAIRQGIKTGILDGAGNVRVVQATGSASGTGNGFGGTGNRTHLPITDRK